MIGGNRQGYKEQFEPAHFGVIELTHEDVKYAKMLYLAVPRFTGLSDHSDIMYDKLMEYGFKASMVADIAMTKMRNPTH